MLQSFAHIHIGQVEPETKQPPSHVTPCSFFGMFFLAGQAGKQSSLLHHRTTLPRSRWKTWGKGAEGGVRGGGGMQLWMVKGASPKRSLFSFFGVFSWFFCFTHEFFYLSAGVCKLYIHTHTHTHILLYVCVHMCFHL